MLKASGRQGVPQGGVISPLFSNVYLNEVDKMLERAKAVTRYQRWTAVEYARFADDLVILVDSHPRQQWLRGAVEKRLREELATTGGGERRKEPEGGPSRRGKFWVSRF